EVRARRRWLESGQDESFEGVLAQVRARDARDMGRADAPLRPAEDAVMLDTSDLSIEQAIAQAIALVATRATTRVGNRP
ncbi:MAG TPA: cytidylate kinase, partial [Paracoccus sp.]|nr:cytidylate kinase [Paracoccus sp. (in: a-proteobacteria)]